MGQLVSKNPLPTKISLLLYKGAVEIIQKDAQENWQKIVEEISDLGDYAPRTLRIAFKKLPRQLGILMGKNSSGTK